MNGYSPIIPSTFLNDYPINERHTFTGKAFGIMCLQLSLTLVIAFPFVFILSFESYLKDNKLICEIVVPIVVIVALGLMFFQDVTQEYPQLIVASVGLTIGEGVCFGIIAATLDLNALLLLPAVAVAVTFVLALCSLQRWKNYTIFSGFLLCIVMSIVGIVVTFVFVDFRDDISTILSGVAAGIFALYFAYDIQRLAYDNRCQMELLDLFAIPLTAYFDIVYLLIHSFDFLAAS